MPEFAGKTIKTVHYEGCKCGGSIVLVKFTDGTAVWITDGTYEMAGKEEE